MSRVAAKARSLLATVVGYVLVALVAFWLFGALLGTIRFIVKAIFTLVVLAVVTSVYLRLKAPPSR